jgi:hypothetical protein
LNGEDDKKKEGEKGQIANVKHIRTIYSINQYQGGGPAQWRFEMESEEKKRKKNDPIKSEYIWQRKWPSNRFEGFKPANRRHGQLLV